MKTVVGVFETANAGSTLNKVYQRGFKLDDITVIDRDRVVRGPAFPDSKTDAVAAVGAANTGGSGASGTPSPMGVPIVGLAVLKSNVRDVLGDLGVSDEESDFYETTVKKGVTLIVVRTGDDRAAEAENTMRHAFASKVAQLK